MSEALAVALVALPGIFALVAGLVRWRVGRRGYRTLRRMSAPARLALLLVGGALAFGACHSIDQGAFARGPVPLAVLPLREPITYTVGPNAGQTVAARNGLLASYFSGAQYVDPAHNEVLDHQQIDDNIDFVWDASDTNPVIPSSSGGIDHNDGDFRLPDH